MTATFTVGQAIEVTEPPKKSFYYSSATFQELASVGTQGIVVACYSNKHIEILTAACDLLLISERDGLKYKTLSELESLRLYQSIPLEERLKRLQRAVMRSGGDPELFAVDSKGVIIPAWKFLGDQQADITLQAFQDGFQAEVNYSPKGCHEYCVMHLQAALRLLWDCLRKYDSKATLTWRDVMDIPQAMMDETDDEHANLGCAPSLSAYQEEPLRLANPRDLPFRFAGGHIHLGVHGVGPTASALQERADQIVQQIDALAGIVLTAAVGDLEDPRRRQFYGRAGEYRLPKHGLEYRVPSSAILCHPAVMHLALDWIRFAFDLAVARIPLWELDSDLVRQVINDSDYRLARAILADNEKALHTAVQAIYRGPTGASTAIRLIQDGVSQHLSLKSIYNNWRLGAPLPYALRGTDVNSLVL